MSAIRALLLVRLLFLSLHLAKAEGECGVFGPENERGQGVPGKRGQKGAEGVVNYEIVFKKIEEMVDEATAKSDKILNARIDGLVERFSESFEKLEEKIERISVQNGKADDRCGVMGPDIERIQRVPGKRGEKGEEGAVNYDIVYTKVEKNVETVTTGMNNTLNKRIDGFVERFTESLKKLEQKVDSNSVNAAKITPQTATVSTTTSQSTTAATPSPLSPDPCPHYQFTCGSRCLRDVWFCDGSKMCDDGSDEIFFDPFLHTEKDGILCRNTFRINNVCLLPANQAHKKKHLCREDAECKHPDYLCKDHSACVFDEWFCGSSSCRDGSDNIIYDPLVHTAEDGIPCYSGRKICLLPIHEISKSSGLCRPAPFKALEANDVTSNDAQLSWTFKAGLEHLHMNVSIEVIGKGLGSWSFVVVRHGEGRSKALTGLVAGRQYSVTLKATTGNRAYDSHISGSFRTLTTDS